MTETQGNSGRPQGKPGTASGSIGSGLVALLIVALGIFALFGS